MKTMITKLRLVFALVLAGCSGQQQRIAIRVRIWSALKNDATPSLADGQTSQEVNETDVTLADGQICRPGDAKCKGSVFLVCNAAA